MKGIASTMLSCAVAVAGGAGIAGGASRARAAYVEVYGGPTYSPAEGGYTKPWVPRAPAGPVVNSAGAAIAYAEKRDSIGGRGLRAVRWDGSGAPAMELQDLGLHPLVAGTESRPAAINSAGSVAGFAQKWDAGGAYRGYWAVRWDSAGAATELENLGGTDSRGISDNRATGITAAGIVYGAAHKYDAAGNDLGARAVRWDTSGKATELGNLGTALNGYTICGVDAVNPAGTVVGGATKYDGAGNQSGSFLVRWDGSGTEPTQLENLPDSVNSNAYGINSSGTVVGVGSRAGLVAVRWDASGTTATELGTLGRDPSTNRNSIAQAINDSGTAAGYSAKFDASGKPKGVRAVRWDASDTAAIELGNLGTDPTGTTSSIAYAINAAGVAAGYANVYDASGALIGPHAVCWDDDGRAVDLNTFIDPAGGWVLNRAEGISDTGWVSGVGSFDPDGPGGQAAYDRLFVIQVPEPGSLALLGIAGLGLFRPRMTGSAGGDPS
jgi:hypothetical protein